MWLWLVIPALGIGCAGRQTPEGSQPQVVGPIPVPQPVYPRAELSNDLQDLWSRIEEAVAVAADDGQIEWHVSVTDDAAAEDLLLRLFLEDRNLKVKHFGRKTYNLEEVFMDLVGKENSN